MSFVAPKSGTKSFTCPHCGVLARQNQWGYGADHPTNPYPEVNVTSAQVRVARCEHCKQNCLWWQDTLVYPYLDTPVAKFARMARGEISEGEATDVRRALLAYCKRDTLAMVRLHEHLAAL